MNFQNQLQHGSASRVVHRVLATNKELKKVQMLQIMVQAITFMVSAMESSLDFKLTGLKHILQLPNVVKDTQYFSR